MKIRSYLLIAAGFCLLSSCQGDEELKTVAKEKVVLPKPLKKIDNIEVRPGLTFDILSWGRGADSLNAVLILRSDTVTNNNTAYNLEIEGKYVETFNTDMDTDGNPEIIIYTTSNKKYSPANVYCLEYGGSEPTKIRFPELTDKTQKQYKGNDKFYLHQGKLRREFNLFDDLENDKAKPVGKKTVEYSLRGNSFDITEIEGK